MSKIHHIQLYTRVQCPLCDEAKKMLNDLQRQHSFTLEEIDISTSDNLTEKYGLMIPVVVIDKIEVQFGKIDKYVIKDYLV